MKRVAKWISIGFGLLVLLPWLGFVVYDLTILKTGFSVGTSFILPFFQLLWSTLAIVGMIMYQWPARLIAISIVAIITIAIVIVVARRRRALAA